MSNRKVKVTLKLPVELADQALATARRLSAEVGGRPVNTHSDAVAALVCFGINTVAIQDALDAECRRRSGQALDS